MGETTGEEATQRTYKTSTPDACTSSLESSSSELTGDEAMKADARTPTTPRESCLICLEDFPPWDLSPLPCCLKIGTCRVCHKEWCEKLRTTDLSHTCLNCRADLPKGELEYVALLQQHVIRTRSAVAMSGLAEVLMNRTTDIPCGPREVLELFEAAAQLGDVHSIYSLGVFYRDGVGLDCSVQPDLSKAEGFFGRAAAAGHRSAQFNLGRLYHRDNSDVAVGFYRQAAAQGHARAGIALTEIDANDRDALARLRALAKDGTAEERWEIGLTFARSGVADEGEALAMLESVSADHNNFTARLGWLFAVGFGSLARDLAKAETLLLHAANNGDVDAMCRLARVLCPSEEAEDAPDVDLHTLVRTALWLSRAADRGHAMAQIVLGKIHRTAPKGFPLSQQSAARLFFAAALQDLPIGQRSLADLYLTGEGVAPNVITGRYWLQKSRLSTKQKDYKGASGASNLSREQRKEAAKKVDALVLDERCETCEAPPAAGSRLKICLGCHSVVYCSSACQKVDHAKHKATCARTRKLRALRIPHGLQWPGRPEMPEGFEHWFHALSFEEQLDMSLEAQENRLKSGEEPTEGRSWRWSTSWREGA